MTRGIWKANPLICNPVIIDLCEVSDATLKDLL
jgi:hypothetical protein